MASCFQTELSKALYMHKGILEKILQSFTEFVGRKEEVSEKNEAYISNFSCFFIQLIVQLINTLCDQTVSGPSTNFLCEMLIYFLNAEEAEKLGCYNKFLQFHEAHKFLWKLSVS